MGPTTTGTAVRLGVDARRRRSRSGGVSRQIAQQRRGYAVAVLRALARTHRGRPMAVVRRSSARPSPPLGVRLSGAELHDLVVGYQRREAGHPAMSTVAEDATR